MLIPLPKPAWRNPIYSNLFSDAPRIDPLLEICRAHLRCLCWGDFAFKFQVSLTKPNRGGFSAPRTQRFLPQSCPLGPTHMMGLTARTANLRIQSIDSDRLTSLTYRELQECVNAYGNELYK